MYRNDFENNSLKTGTRIEGCMYFPSFLLEMPLSMTERIAYVLILNRTLFGKEDSATSTRIYKTWRLRISQMRTFRNGSPSISCHASDVSEEYLHMHRQLRSEKDENGHLRYVELGHTKDERMHPHDGRYVPITEGCRVAIELAKQLPGPSEYLFHKKDGRMITTDSYLQFLRRTCRRLGTLPTNNHAFRIAFNSRLIELGFNPSDRALIPGHEVQTNENHYSITDKRRLESIKTRIRGCEEDVTALNRAPVYQQNNPANMVFSAAVWDKKSDEQKIISLLA